MKWMTMMKYSPQGAAAIKSAGGAARRDAVAEVFGQTGVTLLHWWHGGTPEWDVIMIVDAEPDYAVQASFTLATFATGDMLRATTIPLVDPEAFDAALVPAHPSAE
ncbi:MAG: GYD domain-containing protein [Actinomycetota bacterium]